MLHTIQSLVQRPAVAPRSMPPAAGASALSSFGALGSLGALGALAAAAVVASQPGRGVRSAPAAAVDPGSARGAMDDAASVAAPRDADLARCLVQMLDEIDYGLVLVGADAQVQYLNHAARLELDGAHPLQRLGRTLRASGAQDVGPLHAALAAAQRGLRRLLTMGEGEERISVSVVPLPVGADGERQTLLVLGKRRMCGQLAVEAYGRSVGLTPAEVRVLALLCEGVEPGDVALRHGVKISTVRAQIGSIRTKTGAASIRDLVRQVAVLPPLVGALRAVA
jgi:DNA-binding CsgD family transcriptional regulator